MTDMRATDDEVPPYWPFANERAARDLNIEIGLIPLQAELDRIRAEIGRTRRGRIGLALVDAHLAVKRRLRRTP